MIILTWVIMIIIIIMIVIIIIIMLAAAEDNCDNHFDDNSMKMRVNLHDLDLDDQNITDS